MAARKRRFTTPSLASLGEFGWLKRLLPQLYWPPSLKSQLVLGPGDDAGVVRPTPHRVLVATTDAMVEGIHFEKRWCPWDVLGEKIMAVNLSDLAAMGRVKPLAALVTAAFPLDTRVSATQALYEGMERCARRWKIGFLGGDTVGSRRDWFVSVTVFGEARPQDLLTRHTAQPGDWVVTSGPLGLAAAGLDVLQTHRENWHWTKPLVDAFYYPQPRFADAAQLVGPRGAHSLLDCSDGLEASVKLMAEASRVGIELNEAQLPMAPALARWAKHRGRSAASYALSGGEDYELIFTVSPARWPTLRKKLKRAVVVGHVLPPGQGCWIKTSTGRRLLNQYGYSHFNKK